MSTKEQQPYFKKPSPSSVTINKVSLWKEAMKGVAFSKIQENKEEFIIWVGNPCHHQVLEAVSASTGKQLQSAIACLNMKLYASLVPSQQQIKLKMTVAFKKIVSVSLNITASCIFVREGKTTDEDMQSLTSVTPINGTGVISPLDDFEEEEGSILPEPNPEIMDLICQISQFLMEIQPCQLLTIRIIHRFFSVLIKFDLLSSQDTRGNCKLAFETGEKLGIARVIEPSDKVLLTVPDKLAVMSYLHHLRAHFTGQEMSIMQLGGKAEESSYTSAPSQQQQNEIADERSEITREIITQELMAADEEAGGRRRRQSSGSGSQQSGVLYRRERSSPAEEPQSPSAVQMIKEGAISFTFEFSSSIRKSDRDGTPFIPESPVRPSPAPRNGHLMTWERLTDSFGSDDEDHAANVPSTSSVVCSDSSSQIRRDSRVPSLISVTSPMVTENPVITPSPLRDSKSEDLKERVRKLLEQTKPEAAKNASSSPSKTLTKQGSQEEDERQQQLRERARKLIAEARQGLVASTPGSIPGESATAPASTVGNGLSKVPLSRSQGPSLSPTESVQKFLSKNRKSPTSVQERSPASAAAEFARRDTSHYFTNEWETLETEKSKIDQQAAVVERKLRRLMETGPASSPNAESDEQLMQQWITLVSAFAFHFSPFRDMLVTGGCITESRFCLSSAPCNWKQLTDPFCSGDEKDFASYFPSSPRKQTASSISRSIRPQYHLSNNNGDRRR